MFQQSMNGLNTGGQSVGLVTFLMDGVDASRVDAQTITITYGRSQNRIARVNAEGIEEFKMYENSFSAEFGGSTGAVVNIVTRSGTNAISRQWLLNSSATRNWMRAIFQQAAG